MDNSMAAAKCSSCGEILWDGDTAYRISGKIVCPACVRDGEFICRGRLSTDEPDFKLLAKLYFAKTESVKKRGEKSEQKYISK